MTKEIEMVAGQNGTPVSPTAALEMSWDRAILLHIQAVDAFLEYVESTPLTGQAEKLERAIYLAEEAKASRG